ncbi:hypothetical protein MKEN_00984900 [Mycena kentingensis (nom. inval.)]|nr:hypothetical protein MKEN_00984900 [Mycena kentingensis (nom. inval.)]
MSRDIPTSLIGIASLWPATVLYGVNIVMFIICMVILLKKRGRGEKAPWFLLSAISLQFLLCTAHIICVLGAAVNGFKTVLPTEPSIKLIQTWISPLGKWTASQQLMQALNNFVGDSILIWRLYVLYGNSWLICILPICLACAQLGCNLYSIITTFVNPAFIVLSLKTKNNSFADVVVAGFSLMAATQVLVTVLLAVKIWMAARDLRKVSRGGGRGLATYSSLLWMLVESGSAMAVVDMIWLAVWKQSLGGLAQMILAILGQLCALVPFSIIARVGLRLAFDGQTQAYGSGSGGYPGSKNNGSQSATLEFRARTGGTSTTQTTTSTEMKAMWRDDV